MNWKARWRREHIRPWDCTSCGAIAAYGKVSCSVCGGKAPKTANQRLKDGAAIMVQKLVRRKIAQNRIDGLYLNTYEKMFDEDSKTFYYYNKATCEAQWEQPRLMSKSNHFTLSLETTKQYEQYKQEQESTLVLKAAADELYAERRIEITMANQDKIIQEERALNKVWAGPIHHAQTKGELLANWKELTEFSSTFFNIAPSLNVLRLVGNPLKSLPENFSHSLSRLRVLALSNCQLFELPEDIGTMRCLEDLNLLMNDLRHLPESIGELTNLHTFHLANNKLASLPQSFSRLIKVKKFVFEGNPLESVRDSIVALQCNSISWSNTRLKRLPKSLGDFTTLVTLTADNVFLSVIPKSLGKLRSLQRLSLCNNKIRFIPQEIQHCTHLVRLCLDWNLIETLPNSIVSLSELQLIRLEGNPMRLPPMKIVAQGFEKIKNWIFEQTSYFESRDRKRIVIHLQEICSTLLNDDIVDTALLRGDVQCASIGHKDDAYYAFPYADLFKTLVPLYNTHYTDKYQYSSEETSAALQEFADSYGAISTQVEQVLFKHCGCLGSTRNRICVPPNETYRCSRTATLLKTSIVTQHQHIQRESIEAEEKAVLQEMLQVEETAEQFIQSEQGQDQFNIGALRRATEQLEREEREHFRTMQRSKLEATKSKTDAARDKKRNRLLAKKGKRQELLTAKINNLEALKERVQGWELTKCQEDLKDLQDDMENLPEDDDLILLDNEEQASEDALQEKLDQLFDAQPKRGRLSKAKREQRLQCLQQKQKQRLIAEYMEVLMDKAEERVRYEYTITRKIMHNWLNLTMKTMFINWVDYTRDKLYWKTRRQHELEEIAMVQQENQQTLKHYALIEQAKWIKHVDVYSDQPYWQHNETDQIVSTQPF